MAEADGRDEVLDNLEQVLLCPLADLSCGQGGGGMGDKERAQSLPHLCPPDQRVQAIGEIDDFFQTAGPDSQRFRHSFSRSLEDDDRQVDLEKEALVYDRTLSGK